MKVTTILACYDTIDLSFTQLVPFSFEDGGHAKERHRMGRSILA